jgi:Putative Ig domain
LSLALLDAVQAFFDHVSSTRVELSTWHGTRSIADPDSLLMLSHSCQVPSNKILSWTPRTWAILVSGILIALTAAPRLSAVTAPTFTSATKVAFPQGIQGSFTITTTADPAARITLSGHLPGGVKFVDNGDGTATLSGRPGGGQGLLGDYALTFTASNGIPPAATQNFTLTITRPPRITSVNNATFVVGTAKTFTITTRSTNPKSTLSFTGTLPGGVTFTPLANGTATLSGTAVAGSEGVYFLTITATNGTKPDSVQLFTLTVQDTAPVLHAPAVTSPASTTFTVGTEGTFTVRTTGVPTATLSLTGTQPSWLSFIDNTDGTATLTGIPDTGGAPSYGFTITATNGVAPDAMQSFTLFVVNPPPAITSVNNVTFVVGTFDAFTVRTSPALPSATVSFTGTLPAGISFVPNGDGTATISGTAAAASEGDYPIDITASNGTPPDAMQTFTITVQDSPPVLQAPAITSDATASFKVGTAGTFTITTTGTPTPSLTLTGAQPSWLSFVDNTDGTATLRGTPDADSDLSYSFTITARNGVSPNAMQGFTLTTVQPTPANATLANISTRLMIQTGNKVGIGGFIITGPDPKKVLIRGLGPTLTTFHVKNALQDPVLELHDGTGALIIGNDDWKIPQGTEIAATGLAPPNDHEPAILLTLQPGSYTVFESGKNGTSGVGLIEIYDLDAAANSHLSNISTRGFVQTGANVMIGGFIVSGASGSVIVRALGPTLGRPPFNVSNALQDPFLDLRDANGNSMITNDNWGSASNAAAIRSSGYAPPNSLEAAILITLAPGNYTAIMSGKNGGTGVGLVEVYRLP